MKRLRISVIGAGHLGQIHARLLAAEPAFELVGVVDPRAEARERAGRELNVAAYAHHYEVLGRIEAAIVATPTANHHDVALELLRAGVHCLVEKPLCASTSEADELIEAARAQRLVLQAGHVERFNPALAVVTLPAQPRYLEARRACAHSFRSADIGVVLDLMIHDIDLALTLAGSPLVDVQATGATVLGPHEDLAEARLTFASGCVANLWASRVSPTAERRLVALCEDLHATFDLAAGTAQTVRLSEPVWRGEYNVQAIPPASHALEKERLFSEILPLETLSAPRRNALADEQREFVASIRAGAPVRVSGEAGRAALAVAEQILECLARNRQGEISSETLPLKRPERLRPNQTGLSGAVSLRRAG